MPRIPDSLLQSIIYLYPTVEAAGAGMAAGGTGFIVKYPTQTLSEPGMGVLYAVTNSHVIREGHSPVVRLNTQSGSTAVVPLTETSWFHHHDGDDVAIAPVGLSPELYKYSFVSHEIFLTRKDVEEWNIGPGDDVFFLGRFISHQGRRQNTPIARFGNLALMPGEPIVHERQLNVEAFLIEARSLSGFSGSPVFLFIPPASPRFRQGRVVAEGEGIELKVFVALMGIDSGHYPARDQDTFTSVDKATNSGIMCVTPVWKLEELLNDDAVVAHRRGVEDAWRRSHGVTIHDGAQ